PGGALPAGPKPGGSGRATHAAGGRRRAVTFAAVGHRVAFKGGTLLLRRRLWRPAAFLLGRAIRMAPDHWEAQNNLAIALLKLERWEDAARAAKQAARLNP